MQSILGMVSALDDAVGTVVDTLKQKELYDNSIILFTTDNGGPSNGFDGNAASNFPLRYKKFGISCHFQQYFRCFAAVSFR